MNAKKLADMSSAEFEKHLSSVRSDLRTRMPGFKTDYEVSKVRKSRRKELERQ